MDAVIMDGSNLASGAVASITSARNPVSVARAVMEQTDHPHCLRLLQWARQGDSLRCVHAPYPVLVVAARTRARLRVLANCCVDLRA